LAIHPDWQSNSRYWQQRALLEMREGDLRAALAHANHAITIEAHPYTFNTLAQIHFRLMETANDEDRQGVFSRGFSAVKRAYELEVEKSRVTIYPLATLIQGVDVFFEARGELTRDQKEFLLNVLAQQRARWERDAGIRWKAAGIRDALLKVAG
jgi:hypothetical protein